jgi:hypothetical protein
MLPRRGLFAFLAKRVGKQKGWLNSVARAFAERVGKLKRPESIPEPTYNSHQSNSIMRG